MRTVMVCVPLLMVGNMCLPAMHPQQSDKPPVTEIYELYCWQTPQAAWQFVLLPNTSREKTAAEVFHNPELMSGVEAFRRRLDTLPPGAQIIVVTELGALGRLGPAPGSERLRIPPQQILDDLKNTASKRRIAIDAAAPVHKVYELYCWRSPEGAWQFLVLPTAPRDKTADDIVANPNVMSGVAALRAAIQTLERRAEVVVVTSVRLSPSHGRASRTEQLLPLPTPMLDDLRASVKTSGIHIRQ
ncbi:MAG TPA: hypothetical protein VFK57_07825 [Vicinamibacterales bacterium]|nr:hypothetical protein [Vicinamibacterales bacterium]